jgi:hypothetical protein
LIKNVAGYGISETRQAINMNNKYIVFEKFGDMGVYLVGMEECEEEICEWIFKNSREFRHVLLQLELN